MTMADLQGWVVIARTLASLEILKPLDPEGREKEVIPDFLSGSITYVFSLEIVDTQILIIVFQSRRTV